MSDVTTKAAFTPGPWKVSHGGMPNDSGFSITSDSIRACNVRVTAECWPCTIVSEDHRNEVFANARLIAAAPELLEACEQALAYVEADEIAHGRPFGAGNVLRAAIAKALGTPVPSPE